MARFIYLALVCLCISVAIVQGRATRPWYSFATLPFMGTSTICNNATTRAAYLTSVNNLINDFEKNSSYTAVLKFTTANFIYYIRNNQALLSTNCPAFVTGVANAKKADIEGRKTMKKMDRDIHSRIRQLTRTVVNSYAANDMDVNGEVQ